MQVLNMAEVGELTVKKLSKRDWEIIRNNCITIDTNTKREKTEVGSFIKYLIVLGIESAPFFKSKYLENSRLDGHKIQERENEYYDSEISQNVFDTISAKIREHNSINEPEVKEIKKE